MEISFLGKRVLVTGASKGIGPTIIKQLVKYGAKVIAVDEEGLEFLIKEIPSIVVITVDISVWNEAENALANVTPFDYLVNNAGEGLLKPFLELKKEDIDRLFEINTKALFNITQIVVRDLLSRKKSGSIVNISSEAASANLSYHTVYSASKAAINAFTKAAAIEFAPHNIRVNSINPTVFVSENGRNILAEPHRDGSYLHHIPDGRYHQIEEIVDTIIYLLSDKSADTSGSCLPISGQYLQ